VGRLVRTRSERSGLLTTPSRPRPSLSFSAVQSKVSVKSSQLRLRAPNPAPFFFFFSTPSPGCVTFLVSLTRRTLTGAALAALPALFVRLFCTLFPSLSNGTGTYLPHTTAQKHASPHTLRLSQN
jgi:hypothetical protein